MNTTANLTRFHATVRVFVKFLRIKDEQNRQYCQKCIVIGSQSHKIVHQHVEMREIISV